MIKRNIRIPAYADEFMAGIKYGQITKITGNIATVKLDPPLRFPSSQGPGRLRKTARYPLSDLKPI